MEQFILHVGTVVLPVLLCGLVGFAFAKFDLLFDKRMVGELVSYVGYPALVLSHLSAQHVSIGPFLQMMLAALVMVLAFGVVSFLFLRLVGLPVRAFLSPMMMNNVGNVGLPVCVLALGNTGLAYGLGFVAVVLLGIFTLGIWLPQGRVTLGEFFRKPVIYAVVLAIVLMATDTRLPGPLFDTLSILGGLAIPLMLMTLGHTLATLKFDAVWRGVYLSVFHLAMAVSVAYATVALFGFTGTERAVVILMSIMPVSVATYLWVELYDPEDAPDVAGYILVSTLLAIVVLPVVLTYWI